MEQVLALSENQSCPHHILSLNATTNLLTSPKHSAPNFPHLPHWCPFQRQRLHHCFHRWVEAEGNDVALRLHVETAKSAGAIPALETWTALLTGTLL
mmetsp:Transcript_34921/g.64336  ORF Transcript_34921/g.64336 Transcript_34921/m.64336 type:complete len:97 (+) Transcript_34921:82-372(+)